MSQTSDAHTMNEDEMVNCILKFYCCTTASQDEYIRRRIKLGIVPPTEWLLGVRVQGDIYRGRHSSTANYSRCLFVVQKLEHHCEWKLYYALPKQTKIPLNFRLLHRTLLTVIM